MVLGGQGAGGAGRAADAAVPRVTGAPICRLDVRRGVGGLLAMQVEDQDIDWLERPLTAEREQQLNPAGVGAK